MRQYEVFELIFHAQAPEAEEIKASFAVSFKNKEEITETEGFYAGNGVYKARFYPTKIGIYEWKATGLTGCSEEMSGKEECLAAADGNHGMVRTKGIQFVYEDGTDYIPLGTTVYALVHQPIELVDQTFETLAQAPFNKIRFCIFPKDYNFNKNEPDHFAFVKTEEGFDFTKPDYAFWDMLDERLAQLYDLGIQADMILFHPYDRWGFSKMTEEQCMLYLDYLVRRVTAYPNVWWSLANEYDLMHAFEPERWHRIAAFLGTHDVYRHLLSNHDWATPWDFSDPYVTHCCLQDSDARKIPVMHQKYGKPVMLDEMGYEGNIPYEWGNLSGFEMVNRFWNAIVYGGYPTHGETFINGMDDSQILWWSKGGILKGESTKRIAFMKKILESLPGTPVKDTGSFPDTAEELQKIIAAGTPGVSDNDVMIALSKMDPVEYARIAAIIAGAVVHYEDQAYLTYFGRMCTSIGNIRLPEDKKYTIEVIDVWEMTRTVAARHVSGNAEFALPGKEGMAAIAILEEE